MWSNLKDEDKKTYRKLITNFASLSEAFSQKNESKEGEEDIVAPIVNSKFQETVFQRAFGAIGEDIANTSYDASLLLDDKHKYLVGIKSFGITSGDQKIAQFKKNSQFDNWGRILNEIQKNAQMVNSKEEANEINEYLYKELAIKIARLRNARIESSKEQIKGFKGTDNTVEAVYHVLMPSKKGQKPQIHVGETDYKPIDIDNLEIIGATTKNNPTNFKFTDNNHEYKYTSADSQLYMAFNNRDIVVESWDVNYINDPFDLFEKLNEQVNQGVLEKKYKDEEILKTISWVIYDENGNIPTNSGFNAFNGGSKLGLSTRAKRINKIYDEYKFKVNEEKIKKVKKLLEEVLLKKWSTDEEKEIMMKIRDELSELLVEIKNIDLIEEVEKLIYRPIREMYIPIPNSKKFHESNPDFFGHDIGRFKVNSSKLLLPKEDRTFKLKFLSSGDVIEAYINQDAGKSIQSYKNQQILGEWILQGVFQLAPREILTGDKLNDIGINGIRLIKFKGGTIGLEFIWIDIENPPNDVIGWVGK